MRTPLGEAIRQTIVEYAQMCRETKSDLRGIPIPPSLYDLAFQNLLRYNVAQLLTPEGIRKYLPPPPVGDKDLESDLYVALHRLEQEESERQKGEAEIRAWALLEEELGKEGLDMLRREGRVALVGKGRTYILHMNGEIEVRGKTFVRNGKVRSGKYTTPDMLYTIIKWIKTQPKVLDEVWGCGQMQLQGGEIKT